MGSKPKQSKSPTLTNGKAVCKEIGCFDAPQAKGYCRLHFLKVLAGKGEGDQTPRGELEPVERRRGNRLKGFDAGPSDDPQASDTVEHLGELDTDIEDLDLDPAAGRRKLGKTG